MEAVQKAESVQKNRQAESAQINDEITQCGRKTLNNQILHTTTRSSSTQHTYDEM